MEKFYDNLYFIGFKLLLIDNETWVKINDNYSIRVKLLKEGESSIPEVAIMLCNNLSQNIYEHCISVSKLNEINGMSALFPIMKRCTVREKTEYILERDLTVLNKQYRMCYVPVHIKPVSNDLKLMIENFKDKMELDLIDLLKCEKKVDSVKKNMK